MGRELPLLIVSGVTAWKSWLVREATTSSGVWLVLAKKGQTSPTTLTYAQALDEALCHGWIDGQTRSRDEATYTHRFTPRTSKSTWSARNVAHIARLEAEGRMLPGGQAAVLEAQKDGRWEQAYEGQSAAVAPDDLLEAIAQNPDAQATWDHLNKQNRYAMYLRLKTLRTEAGRKKRIAASVESLARGHPPLVSKNGSVKQAPSASAGRKPQAAKGTPRVSKRTKPR